MRGGIGAEAFERLYNEHAERLLGFLTYQTGDRALAEDIVADTFERVLTTRSGWQGRSGEKTWLYSIAMNRLRDLARRRGAEGRAVERVAASEIAGGSSAGEDLGAVADRDLLQRGLQTLPEEERAVVALRFGGDLSLREIADLLGERQTAVEGRLYRALRRLRDAAG
jgi:RNA polymerase sigma factor (sigma-70 family)